MLKTFEEFWRIFLRIYITYTFKFKAKNIGHWKHMKDIFSNQVLSLLFHKIFLFCTLRIPNLTDALLCILYLFVLLNWALTHLLPCQLANLKPMKNMQHFLYLLTRLIFRCIKNWRLARHPRDRNNRVGKWEWSKQAQVRKNKRSKH